MPAAGLMLLSKLENLEYDEWEKMIDTNLKGTLYGIGAVLPYFKAQKAGMLSTYLLLQDTRFMPAVPYIQQQSLL